ncbi:DNA helicase RecQ [Sporanaerobium hydrogeniformans]|uniref:DNA helicase RecQ n=1 Tax=Sporanaerobium hydrogeniformans TaxID=3072179 RepID=A0AC61D916_9FIRM|nr:DNA helicase RecQ [Sporanaerobium hydrogeniformans]PHV69238.1 DNA helicase RecQ [Sporanaerobium hydrogeniformans]
MNAKEILKKYYGYDAFRPGQKELINHIIEGRDVIGIMPTGGGKSLCYQIPALLLEGITIVISPLISLMKDQVDTLKEYGIKAELINSTLSMTEFRGIMMGAREKAYKILYVAPERLEAESFIDLLKELPISLIAVDEAHCVSQWGHDFRPSYRRISQMLSHLEKRPVVAAFTATATPLVKEDIIKLLRLEQPFELVSNFDRPNLYFEVRKPQNKLEEIRQYLLENKDKSGIIYCATRKNVEEVCERLNRLGILATKYHGGLGEQERSENQEDFLYDRMPIMVATNAFGMGIDKPNVRFVLHYNMPKNMESYYQEAGRAGRDGEAAECIMLFSTQDIMTNRFLIENASLGVDHSQDYQKLNHMVDYCNTQGCLRSYILTYFGQVALEEDCKHCGNCNNEIEETDITREAQIIMSCVRRMREQFGSTLVTDVLKGANTQKIRDFNFHELSTYGLMREYSKESIKELISFLIAEGYLLLAGNQYPILKLTPQSYPVLKGEEKITIRRLIMRQKELPEEVRVEAHELFTLLRQERYKLAKAHKVQPFMIFPDTSLKDMCKRYPITAEEFLQVSGVGEHKLQKYGENFILLIKEYVETHTIKKELSPSMATGFTIPTKSAPRDSHKLTYSLYRQGLTLEEIAKERNLTELTVENHLVKCVEEGLEVDYADFIPEKYEKQIIEAIQICGTTLLKPIKEALPSEVSYTAIKFSLLKLK